MKKRSIFSLSASILAVVITAITLTACFSRDFWEYADWISKDTREITDAAMSRICSGIADRNANKVKAEFAYADVDKVRGFDESIQKLFDYITGDNISFKLITGGSESAALGSYPKERELNGVRYEIVTDTDSYKVCFDYRSYYSDKAKNNFEDVVRKDKMGFLSFDIINKKGDRPTSLYYSGCPENLLGINFDYKTRYLSNWDDVADSFEYEKIYCEKSATFGPIIMNSVSDLEKFRNDRGDSFTLGSRPDGRGYADVVTKYDQKFFETHSICISGKYRDGGNIMYVPQWLYIGDYVMTYIAEFEYDDYTDDNIGDYAENGVIIIIELPEKVSSDIEVKISAD